MDQNKDFFDKLNEILKEWNSKSASRERTIEYFFSGGQKHCRNQIFNTIKHNF